MNSVKIIVIAILCSSCASQQLEDYLIQMMKRTIDMVSISTQKIDDMQAKLNAVEEQLAASPECAKRDQLEVFQNTSEEEFQQIRSSVQQCAGKEQIEDFQELLSRDECEDASHNCSELATCKDSMIHFSCSCLPGYYGDGFTCQDIDECNATDAGPCGANEMCSNDQGSYECSCKDGFEMRGGCCQDIDECSLGLDGCHRRAVCHNIEGSYSCECQSPYSGNGYTCNGLVCKSPSLYIEEYGCITPVFTHMEWAAAEDHCLNSGLKLLEEVEQKDLSTLRNHFLPLFSSTPRAWIGFKGKRWTTSKTAVSHELLAVNEGTLDNNCGFLDMRPGYDFGLWDHPCSGYEFYSLCQTIQY